MLKKVDDRLGGGGSLPSARDIAKRLPSFWISNALVLGAMLALMYGVFPRTLSWLVYQQVYGHLLYGIFVVIGGIVCVLAFGMWDDRRRQHLAFVYGALGIFIIAGGCFVQWSGSSSVLAERHTFPKRAALLDNDKAHVRFTPYTVASRGMKTTFSDSAYKLDEADMAVTDIDSGFGYVVPVIPNGWLQPFWMSMEGFVIFNDDPALPDNQRVRRVHQTFAYGLGMQWFDDMWQQLAYRDLFAVYGKPYYLQLDPKNRDKFTIVVPKMTYRWGLAAYFVPVTYLDWGGVALVHDDGTIENLSVDQAKADKRLAGKMIYPYELAERVVKAQVYDQGIMSGWYQRPGKISVPHLPGRNQMPYLIRGTDGRSYDVVLTEPAGSQSLYRVYAIDTTTGDRSMFEYDIEKQGLIGPEVAISYGKSLPGYNWVEKHKEGETGNFQLIEPIPVIRNGILYYKTTLTQRDATSVIATVVIDPAQPTEGIQKFEHRSDFIAWLNGSEKAPAAKQAGGESDSQTLLNRARESLKTLQGIIEELDAARKK